MRRRPPLRSVRGQEGFALVETLVAAAIIAGMTAVLFQTVAADARVAAALRERRRAAMLAQSALDEATSAAAVSTPDTQGRWQEMRWQVLRAPYGGGRDSGPPLERITVRVRAAAGGRALVTLQTLRLAR